MNLDSLSKEKILNQIEKLHEIDIPDNLLQQELSLITKGLTNDDRMHPRRKRQPPQLLDNPRRRQCKCNPHLQNM